MSWILERLKEPSTWRGLTALAAIAGVTVSPELQTQIVGVAVGIIGLIEMLRKEKQPER